MSGMRNQFLCDTSSDQKRRKLFISLLTRIERERENFSLISNGHRCPIVNELELSTTMIRQCLTAKKIESNCIYTPCQSTEEREERVRRSNYLFDDLSDKKCDSIEQIRFVVLFVYLTKMTDEYRRGRRITITLDRKRDDLFYHHR